MYVVIFEVILVQNHTSLAFVEKRSVDLLKIHLQVHSGLNAYGCEHCSIRFACKYSLGLHIRKHSGEEPRNAVSSCSSETINNPKTDPRNQLGERRNDCGKEGATENRARKWFVYTRGLSHTAWSSVQNKSVGIVVNRTTCKTILAQCSIFLSSVWKALLQPTIWNQSVPEQLSHSLLSNQSSIRYIRHEAFCKIYERAWREAIHMKPSSQKHLPKQQSKT